MTQVSKRCVTKDVEERVLDLFWTAFTHLQTKQSIAIFLQDLLTKTEKVMLSKRFAIAFMLMKGYEYPIINDILKVSDATVWRVKMQLAAPESSLHTVLEGMLQSEKWKTAWRDLEHNLSQIFPPRHGTNWKEARKKQWQKRRSQQKSF